MTASSIETIAYSASQFSMLYFLAREGTGVISANNCATRIGMLGFSLLAQPLTCFIQGQLCAIGERKRQSVIRAYLAAMAICTCVFAGAVYHFRIQVIELIYMRGNFSRDALGNVAEILPAWLGYFVILSMNAVAARYLFTISSGAAYTRHMLCGYALTNCLRLIAAGHLPAASIIWCAVIGEGTALLFNLRACVTRLPYGGPVMVTPELAGAST